LDDCFRVHISSVRTFQASVPTLPYKCNSRC
jgi:hypothetical protein